MEQTAVIDRQYTKETPKITSLSEMNEYVQSHADGFIKTLADIGSHMHDIVGMNMGYQTVEANGMRVIKKSVNAQEPGIFTGKGLCDLAAYALQEGLGEKAKGIMLDVVSVFTDTNGENWAQEGFSGNDYEHYIVQAFDPYTDQYMYYDPTYGQVHHKKSGEIVIVTKEALATHYKSKSQLHIKNVMQRKQEVLTALKKYGLQSSDYQSLIETLS